MVHAQRFERGDMGYTGSGQIGLQADGLLGIPPGIPAAIPGPIQYFRSPGQHLRVVRIALQYLIANFFGFGVVALRLQQLGVLDRGRGIGRVDLEILFKRPCRRGAVPGPQLILCAAQQGRLKAGTISGSTLYQGVKTDGRFSRTRNAAQNLAAEIDGFGLMIQRRTAEDSERLFALLVPRYSLASRSSSSGSSCFRASISRTITMASL